MRTANLSKNRSEDDLRVPLSERLARETRRLSEDVSAPEDAIKRELENAAFGYLESATVDEFVPLLASRRAKARLEKGAGR